MKNKLIILLAVGGALGVAVAISAKRTSKPQPPLKVASAKLSVPTIVDSRTVLLTPKMEPSLGKGALEAYSAATSEQLSYVLGTSGDGSYLTREAALKVLTNNLAQDDIAKLLGFISDPKSVATMDLLSGAAVKNDVINLLRNQEPRPQQLTQTLLEISKDLTQSPTMRDYALQHLGGWAVDGADPKDLPKILDALKEGVRSAEGSVPGTSLLQLEAIYKVEPQQLNALKQLALEQLNAEHPNSLTLATALQVCAHLQVEEAYPKALWLAQSSTEDMPLRISAVAVLGDLGGTDTRGVLKALINGSEPRLQLPAHDALRRLNKRLGI